MLIHEAKAIANGRIPQHLREEAVRVVRLHESMRGTRAAIDEFQTVSEAHVARANAVLIVNLIKECCNRSWLPLPAVRVTRTTKN
jgi:hypothetical protein